VSAERRHAEDDLSRNTLNFWIDLASFLVLPGLVLTGGPPPPFLSFDKMQCGRNGGNGIAPWVPARAPYMAILDRKKEFPVRI
jgi:hypothetical protein